MLSKCDKIKIGATMLRFLASDDEDRANALDAGTLADRGPRGDRTIDNTPKRAVTYRA